jgi:LysM repeat protein
MRIRITKIFLYLVACAVIFTPLRLGVTPAHASPTSASEVIALVNQLRASNGLAAYRADSALMAAAQAHSEYQAAIGSITHSGQGGSTPHDRAAAAGYGGGGTIIISENIMGGRNLSAAQAVQAWQGDAPHLGTMLNPSGRDAGVGIATVGDMVYMTLDTGYKAGEATSSPPGTAPSAAPPAAAPPAAGTAAATVALIVPVVTSTPNPDGSVIHVVLPGQVLINIAAAYNMKLSELLALNGLTDKSVIYPGEKLIIMRASMTVTPEMTPTATSGTPTATPTATITATPDEPTPLASGVQLDATLNPSPTASPPPATQAGSDPLLIAIGVLVVVGTLLVVVGFVLKRRP